MSKVKFEYYVPLHKANSDEIEYFNVFDIKPIHDNVEIYVNDYLDEKIDYDQLKKYTEVDIDCLNYQHNGYERLLGQSEEKDELNFFDFVKPNLDMLINDCIDRVKSYREEENPSYRILEIGSLGLGYKTFVTNVGQDKNGKPVVNSRTGTLEEGLEIYQVIDKTTRLTLATFERDERGLFGLVEVEDRLITRPFDWEDFGELYRFGKELLNNMQ